MLTTSVGFQDTENESSSPVPENAVLVELSVTACAAVSCPGTNDANPLLAVAGPDQ